MPTKYASGKNAIAECDRCGERYKLKELKKLVIKLIQVNILVCPECWDPDQPQLHLGMYPVNDPQAIRDPRADTSYVVSGRGANGYVQDGSRQIQWGWAPVGGASGFDTLLTPNTLISQGLVGSVTITTT
jgi:hypothetical protein